jgi:hypothetical protein
VYIRRRQKNTNAKTTTTRTASGLCWNTGTWRLVQSSRDAAVPRSAAQISAKAIRMRVCTILNVAAQFGHSIPGFPLRSPDLVRRLRPGRRTRLSLSRAKSHRAFRGTAPRSQADCGRVAGEPLCQSPTRTRKVRRVVGASSRRQQGSRPLQALFMRHDDRMSG